MKKTFVNFSKLAKSYPDQDATAESAVLHYQATGDMICVPYVFCKVYAYLTWRSNMYFYLTDEDKSSFCLEELTKVMESYDPSKNTSVRTMLDKYVNNRLRKETEALSYDKRKLNNGGAVQFNNELIVEYCEGQYDSINVMETLKAMNLTGNELQYCKIIMDNPSDSVRDVDIAKTLGITKAGINYIKNSLSKKVSFCY